MSTPLAYLDHAASTPVRPEVREAMRPWLDERFGNPSSAHAAGRAARVGLDAARRELAEALGTEPAHVVFTSGGTEADNLAVTGAALAAREHGRRMHVAVAASEHKAVLAPAHFVAALGGEETVLPVDGAGLVDLAAVDAVLARGPALLSVMWVNNEVGTIQPVAELAARARAAGVPFHTDAVQAVGKLPVSLRELPGALVTLSGHKLGAPKGIGALVVPGRHAVAPLVRGGSQQLGIRPGTENVAGAVALGCAVRLAQAEQRALAARLEALRRELEAGILAAVPDAVVLGAGAPRAPHVTMIAFPGAEAGALLAQLDLEGVAASAGSACTTGSPEPSHVVSAMGVPPELALGAIRLSLGRESTADDVARVVAALPGALVRVRRLQEALGRG